MSEEEAIVNDVQARDAVLAWQRTVDATFQEVVRKPANPADRQARLLARYQVRSEDTTLWPNGMIAWLAKELKGIEPELIAETEAAMLDDLQKHRGLMVLKEFADIQQDALDVAEGKFDGHGWTDGHQDAFRHAYWNARMTHAYGEPWAAEFATAHERHPAGHSVPVAMDLHNNEVGRAIAQANPDASPEQLAELVERAVRNGRMLVIDQTDTLMASNEVLPGETRDPGNTRDIRGIHWPADPDRAGHRDPGEPTAPVKPGPIGF